MTNDGICIGGPLDGTRLSHYDTIWRADTKPESLGDPTLTKICLDVAMNAKREVVTYRYASSIYQHDGKNFKIGFWLLGDMTMLDAFAALAVRYQEPRRHRSLLKQAGKLIDRLLRSSHHPESFKESIELLEMIREEVGKR